MRQWSSVRGPPRCAGRDANTGTKAAPPLEAPYGGGAQAEAQMIGWGRPMLAALAVALATLAAAQAPAAPMVRVEGLKPISPHVQVIPDNSAPLTPNVGFVVGLKAVLVVDTGLG